jgi:zinc protease
MDDLQNMTWRDARNWYDKWYVPNNALVVVVGDVNAKEVFEQARKYFGGIKARALPERKPQDEPPQRGIRRVTVKAPADLPYIIMGYRVPKLRDPQTDWEPYALEVLAGVLDGNEAARLNATLVRGERIANNVDAGYDSTSRGPGLFTVSGAPTTGKTVDELERGVRRELGKIISDGVGEEELKRVKAQVVAGHVFQRDSMFAQAQLIGSLETAGYSYKTIDLMIDKIQQVTAAQVQEVARKYMVDDELTVAVLDPQPLDGKKKPAPSTGGRHGD